MALSSSNLTLPDRGPRCSVCEATRTLPKADAAQLVAWLTDPAIPFTVIALATRDDADTPTLGAHALARHARGQCLGGERIRP